MRILFQGDSITDGNRGRGKDPNHVIGHSFPYTVASYLGAKYPEKNLEFFSRGISGDTVKDLKSRWRNDTINLKPDILCILIGVNDALMHQDYSTTDSPDYYEDTYRSILKEVSIFNPDIKFIILEPFTEDIGNIDDFNDFQRKVKYCASISRKLASEFDGLFIPLQSIFDNALNTAPASYWIWDSVHPTYNGHGLIAKSLTEKLQNFFNEI